MKILLCNDDGIQAKALSYLKKYFEKRGDEVTITAPSSNRSAAGMSLSLSNPIRVEEQQDKMFSIQGTPCDCVNYALSVLATEFDLVISGINEGSNVGYEIWYSGTVSAARVAHMTGVPAMALSVEKFAVKDEEWEMIMENFKEHYELWEKEALEGQFLNINFPKQATEQSCSYVNTIAGTRNYINHLVYEDAENGYQYRGEVIPEKKKRGTDDWALSEGLISVTRLEHEILSFV